MMAKGEMCPSQLNARETSKSPEQKRRKHQQQQPQHHNNWAGSSRYVCFQCVLLKLENEAFKWFYYFHFFPQLFVLYAQGDE